MWCRGDDDAAAPSRALRARAGRPKQRQSRSSSRVHSRIAGRVRIRVMCPTYAESSRASGATRALFTVVHCCRYCSADARVVVFVLQPSDLLAALPASSRPGPVSLQVLLAARLDADVGLSWLRESLPREAYAVRAKGGRSSRPAVGPSTLLSYSQIAPYHPSRSAANLVLCRDSAALVSF